MNNIGLSVLLAGALLVSACAHSSDLTDEEIRQQMIEESIRTYPGNCPCPFNRASNGSRCGKRSAWSKPGGRDPLCYATDISDEMAARYRKQHSK